MKSTFSKQDLVDFCNNIVRFYAKIWEKRPIENLKIILELDQNNFEEFIKEINLKSNNPPDYIKDSKNMESLNISKTNLFLNISKTNLIGLAAIIKILLESMFADEKNKFRFYAIQFHKYLRNVLGLTAISCSEIMNCLKNGVNLEN